MWPACSHRGAILTSGRKCYCRYGPRPQAVTRETCAGCPVPSGGERQIDAAAPPPAASDEERLPCAYRTAEPVGEAACRGCQNEGRKTLPVYGCGVLGSCIVRGTPLQPHDVAGCCLTCAERNPLPAGLWDHPTPEERPAWQRFVAAWTHEWGA